VVLDPAEPPMDDLTAQERQLILKLRYPGSFTMIIHRNEHWRIVLADPNADGIKIGEGSDFESAWDDLGGHR
jgi:hypothetical protein